MAVSGEYWAVLAPLSLAQPIALPMYDGEAV